MEATYFTELLQHRPLGTNGATSSCTMRFGNVPIKTGVVNLYGCTSVVVTCDEGLWISHFFESPSFVSGDAQFQSDVINALQRNDYTSWHEKGVGELAPPGEMFTSGDTPRVYIITPRPRKIPPEAAQPGSLMYPKEIEQIKATLSKQIPNADPPTVIDYIPRGPDLVYQTFGFFGNTFGKVLIEYDPINSIIRGPPGVQYTSLKLRVEDTLICAGTWRAWPHQVVRTPGDPEVLVDERTVRRLRMCMESMTQARDAASYARPASPPEDEGIHAACVGYEWVRY